MLILDSHCDTPSELLRGRDLHIDNPGAHVDFPKLRKAGVDACFFALYTSAELSPDQATRRALEMLSASLDAIEHEPDFAVAVNATQVRENKASGKHSILFGMENGAPVQHSLSLLRLFHRMGVRYLTLTHNGDNEIADCAAEGKRWNGLSPFGREVIAEMNRIGMIPDMAHVSDKTFYDCLAESSKPLVSTHSCCRALAGHARNMTDDMIRAMADKGGVIQINFYPVFLSDAFARDGKPLPGVRDIVDHIDHAVRVGGIEAVGIGTDYDGIEVTPEGLEDVSCLGRVFDEMKRRGYSDDAIGKVAGENFMRVFAEVCD